MCFRSVTARLFSAIDRYVRSSVLIESVQTREATASEVRPEIVIDPGVFTPYKPWVGTTVRLLDRLARRPDSRRRVGILRRLLGDLQQRTLGSTRPTRLGTRARLGSAPGGGKRCRTHICHDCTGAGWGRWLSAGAFASEQTGREYRLVGVEAEPQHFEWMERHFRDNNLKWEWSSSSTRPLLIALRNILVSDR